MTPAHSPSIEVVDDRIFHLRTATSSLVLAIGSSGHVDLWWYGAPLEGAPDTLIGLAPRWAGVPGLTISHGDGELALARQTLAWSSHGKGDYAQPGIGLVGHRVLDLTYASHRVGEPPGRTGWLPMADPEPASQTLQILLSDPSGLDVELSWTTFPQAGVISRHTLARNSSAEPMVLDRLASQLVDLPNLGFDVLTLDGWWLSEAHQQRTPLRGPMITNASINGASSAAHNPGVILLESDATEDRGRCYGFNLVYSGSHATTVEVGQWGQVRLVSGLNPTDFEWRLEPGQELQSPESVMTFTDAGLNGVRRAFHSFVNDCIVPPHWRGRARPVVFNHWEGTYFDYDSQTLLTMADAAARLGVETFVVDDGWFGERDSDRRGLGDWEVNTTKLGGTLADLAAGLTQRGLGMGLWVEPESVNTDSDLYRQHPDWAIHTPGLPPSEGRHQLLLDFTRAEVRDHLVDRIGVVLDEAGVDFVKWDMNRLISDAVEPGFHHRYILGLYEVLGRLFGPRPHILLETCSSGGNRFDLGMFSFGAQAWASDCTDPHQRLTIQEGHSLFYPASTISAHVSASPNHQTGRTSSIDFRFGVAAPYVFGVELDPRTLSEEDAALLTGRIAWYRDNRERLQFGEHLVLPRGLDGRRSVAVRDQHGAFVAEYGVSPRPGDGNHLWHSPGFDADSIRVERPFDDHEPLTIPMAAARAGVWSQSLPDGHWALSEVRPIRPRG